MLIGIPSRGVVFSECLSSLMRFYDRQVCELYITSLSPVSKARNAIIERFLASGHEHLLMLDDDEVMPVNGLTTLFALEADIAVLDAPAKKTGRSNIFRNRDGSIAATGFGCALFRRRVFESIPSSWFDLAPRRKIEKRDGVFTFPVLDDAPPNPWGGEDLNFSVKLKDYGFTIQAVEGLVCKHLEALELQKENRATEILNITTYGDITDEPV